MCHSPSFIQYGYKTKCRLLLHRQKNSAALKANQQERAFPVCFSGTQHIIAMSQVNKVNQVHYVFREGEDSALSSPPWNLKQDDSGPMAKAMNSYVHFSSSRQPARNKWSFFKTSDPVPLPSGGLLLTTRVCISKCDGNEVKQNLTGGIILRLTSRGSVAKYQYYVGGFRDLANSSIRPDGAWHDISIIYQQNSTVLFEDGVFKFKWDKDNGTGLPLEFSCQNLDAGSSMSLCLGNISVSSLSNALSQHAFEEGKDDKLSQYPWKLTPNPSGPSLKAHDGFVTYAVDNQPARNQWLKFGLVDPLDISTTLSVNMRLRAPKIQSSEVKFALPGGLIIRYTDNGRSALYQYWNPGFQTLGECGVKGNDNTWKNVSIVYSPKRMQVYENGALVVEWEKDFGNEIEGTFNMQSLDTRSSMQIDMSNVEIDNACFWKQ